MKPLLHTLPTKQQQDTQPPAPTLNEQSHQQFPPNEQSQPLMLSGQVQQQHPALFPLPNLKPTGMQQVELSLRPWQQLPPQSTYTHNEGLQQPLPLLSPVKPTGQLKQQVPQSPAFTPITSSRQAHLQLLPSTTPVHNAAPQQLHVASTPFMPTGQQQQQRALLRTFTAKSESQLQRLFPPSLASDGELQQHLPPPPPLTPNTGPQQLRAQPPAFTQIGKPQTIPPSASLMSNVQQQQKHE
jgi:hypothetical protein